jgi:hypothetical protein
MSEKMIPYTPSAQLICAENFASSGYFKDARSAAQAFVKIQFGQELGLPAAAAMASIHIIEGKPVLSSAAMASLIKRSGVYKYKILVLDDNICTVQITENGEVLTPDSSFSWAEAKAAGLDKNMPWQKYRQDMLFSRAIARAFKRHCPDLSGGSLYVEHEIPTAEAVVESMPSIEGVMSVRSISESLDDGSADLIFTIDGLARQKWGDKFRAKLARFREENGFTGGLISNSSMDELTKLIELLTPAEEGQLI